MKWLQRAVQHQLFGPLTANLFIGSKDQLERPAQLLYGDVGDGREGTGDEPLGVAGTTAEELPIALYQFEGLGPEAGS